LRVKRVNRYMMCIYTMFYIDDGMMFYIDDGFYIDDVLYMMFYIRCFT
jgi:hypothetical protein